MQEMKKPIEDWNRLFYIFKSGNFVFSCFCSSFINKQTDYYYG